MNKLKTLKDLQKDYEWKYDTYIALKQEAIKWIKEFKDCNDIYKYSEYMDNGFGEYTDEPFETIIIWIMDFFNISYEDLK